MRVFSLLFPLFITIFFTSCQVKEGASSGLVSGHRPATNSFVLATPATKTYVAGETLNLQVSFPFDLIKDNTGGEPRLRITVGATTRYATFVSQPDPKTMSFSYSFVAAENDTDGVTVNALELNGSTLKFDNNGTITDCVVTSLASKTLSNVKVDTQSPSISAFSMTNIPGMYNVGENITFAMTFSENVYVTGSPSFGMSLAGTPVDVDYVSGSGSTVLLFTYTVTATDSDTNGFDSITSPLALNGGTIKDAVGNDSLLDFSSYVTAAITYSSGVHISGQMPFIIDTIFPANKIYVAAEDLDFILIFDRDVTVSGLPYLNVTIGSNVRQAQYVSGSGTEQITFRYTSVPGDVDANGVDVATSIAQNAGNIVDTLAPANSFFGDALNNSYTHPATTGIILNAIQPQATAVARNLDASPAIWGTSVDNVWIPGQDLNITVSFNTNMYVNQTSGTPSIPITIGSTTREAIYLSGGNGQTSLVFRYTVQDGDLDTDGTIALGNISLNGGVITDSENTNTLLTLPVAGLSTTRIDGVKPTISSVAAPANGTYSTVATLNEATMSFTVTWSEAVNLSTTSAGSAYIAMDVGGTAVNLNYVSGNQTVSTVHRPASLASRNDANGVSLTSPLAGTAVIRDQAGNAATVFTFTPPNTASILVDTTAPTVTSVTAITANGTYKAGQNLDFSVTFSESVTVNRNGGYPRIPVTIGGTTRYLEPTANGTGTNHTFRYTIVANEVDTDGVLLTNTVQHNGTGYARDGGRNNSIGTFTLPNTTGIRVDAQAPTILSVTPTTNGSYVSGNQIQISVRYSEIVNVNTGGGTPTIALDFALGTDNLSYVSGTGTDTIVFSRTLGASHFDMDGLSSSITAITLNSGTIQDVGTNNAPTAFPTAIDMSQVYVTYSGVKVWTKNNFVNLAPAGSPAISNNGTATTAACGSGTCRVFDGDDSLYLSGSLNGVETVFMAYRIPSAVGVDQDMFGPDITIDAKITNYDIRTQVNSDLIYDGSPFSVNTVNHNTNSALNSTHVIQVDYNSPRNYSGETLIGTTFDGGIGEVIAVEGSLTTTQKDNIRNYLQSRY